MQRILLVVASVSMLANCAYADCTDTSNPIGQAQVAALRSEADAAEQRAEMSPNAVFRRQNESVAQNLRSRADSLEQEQQAIANAGQQLCNALTNRNDDSNENDDSVGDDESGDDQ